MGYVFYWEILDLEVLVVNVEYCVSVDNDGEVPFMWSIVVGVFVVYEI